MSESTLESKEATVTFDHVCPVSSKQHSFTLDHDDVLSSEKLEEIAKKIRYSWPRNMSEERSRALMEVIYKVIKWEKGYTLEHPVLPQLGSYPEAKKRKLV
ncbi:hypothetical protein BM221_001212 [Beauveria bassiana]|uniref:Uncharacterized protein n=1 Tax=Beauveria bassiana TaxID=176275 RepID=A0A2N6P2Q7_BEABA|nr:hypothetical protein BM221_001212 [Beauveria bassiana]